MQFWYWYKHLQDTNMQCCNSNLCMNSNLCTKNFLEGQGHRHYSGTCSNMEHLVTLKIVAKECWKKGKKKNNIFCFFDFRRFFERVPRNNLCNILEDLEVPFELRDFWIRLYENVNTTFRNTKSWLNEIIVI